MKFVADITVKEDADLLEKCIKPEIKTRERSSFTIKKKKDSIVFHVEAKDAVAFRATMNSLLQLLSVHHKMEKIKNG
jgi:tRNA threonylcarbamoyladenosine modification (KEOPS) complex  Pcc1 subunit